jgi:hypothetical protein
VLYTPKLGFTRRAYRKRGLLSKRLEYTVDYGSLAWGANARPVHNPKRPHTHLQLQRQHMNIILGMSHVHLSASSAETWKICFIYR